MKDKQRVLAFYHAPVYQKRKHAVADPGGPRVPRILPFSLAIVALPQLPASYLSVFVAIVI